MTKKKTGSKIKMMVCQSLEKNSFGEIIKYFVPIRNISHLEEIKTNKGKIEYWVSMLNGDRIEIPKEAFVSAEKYLREEGENND